MKDLGIWTSTLKGVVDVSGKVSQPPGAGLLTGRLPPTVCAFPYLLAFTPDSMEIRLVVNGNLVHTAVVPQLQLVASRVSRARTREALRAGALGWQRPTWILSGAGGN